MRRLGVIGAVLAVAVGCDSGENPCDVYVDYMCECHGQDSGFDCEELRATYVDAGPTLQDQCSEDLAAQQDSDEAAGVCG